MHVNAPQYGIIRQFDPKDLRRVLEIAEESLTEYYTTSLIIDLYEAWPDGFRVYISEDRIEGFVIGSRIKPNEARILMFAVDGKYRKRGIGDALMRDFMEYCGKNGFISIKLEVKTDNDNAINFYKKYGFAITSRLRAYYSDASDAFAMWKII